MPEHHPTRAELDTLVARARELELGDEHIGHELEEIHACVSALDLADAIARGELPIVETNDQSAGRRRLSLRRRRYALAGAALISSAISS